MRKPLAMVVYQPRFFCRQPVYARLEVQSMLRSFSGSDHADRGALIRSSILARSIVFANAWHPELLPSDKHLFE